MYALVMLGLCCGCSSHHALYDMRLAHGSDPIIEDFDVESRFRESTFIVFYASEIAFRDWIGGNLFAELGDGPQPQFAVVYRWRLNRSVDPLSRKTNGSEGLILIPEDGLESGDFEHLKVCLRKEGWGPFSSKSMCGTLEYVDDSEPSER